MFEKGISSFLVFHSLYHLMKDYDVERVSDEKIVLRRKKNEKR